MSRTRFIFTMLPLLTSLATPPAAQAWPLGRWLHLHPTVGQSKDVPFRLLNRSDVVQNITVDGQSLALMPNSELTVHAPIGTQVTSNTHGTPDVLFVVQPTLRHTAVVIR